tara:strand:+ start:1918 stop:2142 length:225 start_codon:yes stop_codon:yes gene_type:complete
LIWEWSRSRLTAGKKPFCVEQSSDGLLVLVLAIYEYLGRNAAAWSRFFTQRIQNIAVVFVKKCKYQASLLSVVF